MQDKLYMEKASAKAQLEALAISVTIRNKIRCVRFATWPQEVAEDAIDEMISLREKEAMTNDVKKKLNGENEFEAEPR